ncbi:MAG TPA: sulfotransferase [Verrucomicrobiae bacterium]|nr:sulfotransferase [Verrucomicrobiae bacterium]
MKEYNGGFQGVEAGKRIRKSFAERVSHKLWYLDSNKLREQAQRRTGLRDFGDPPIEPALSILTASLEEEAGLHALGRFLMRGHLLGILEMRLGLAAIWKSEPGLLDSPIEKPVFITGMPRSGSTFLHELLSQDPDNRSPRVWEVMFPVPAPEPGVRRDPRMRRANANLWWFRRLAPGADEVYPVRAVTPHECLAIHSYTLMSEEFVTTCRVPAYEYFLRQTGLRRAYAWQKLFLQHLQSRSPLKRWILKSPDHLYGLEELFSVFPDAMIIQTHRNPIDVLKSSLQLTEVVQGLFARPDRDCLQEREARTLAETMERSIRFRDQHPEMASRFLDLNYSEIVSDPLGTARRIYQHLDCPVTATAIERMRQFIATRSRYQRRRNPTLADLGLDVRAETRRFQNYCRRFGISMQPARVGQ